MKKYRWNKKKFLRNMSSLILRTVIVTIVLVLLGAGPRVEGMDMDSTGSDTNEKQVQLMMYKEKPDRDLNRMIVVESQPKYSEEDLYWLSHVIAGEALGCDDTEQIYVASVVLNRVAHHLFPDTIEGVVTQKSQYGCYRNGQWSSAANSVSDRCVNNAIYVLENGPQLPANVVFQSKFAQGDGLYVQTAWHKYCYTNK